MSRTKVLVDRHQADLLFSLQLLFEDRLGLDLYVPVGHEWWEEGYWRFGEVFGDDRLAQQYLTIDSNWLDCHGDGLSLTFDKAHPDRPIYGITLEQARKERDEFAFVVATVQENQMGFKRLADELGARYVVQVGNNNQQINWELAPLALVSSNAAIPDGVRGVHYHQEFRQDVFHFTMPATSARIASFVNCMPLINCWPVLEQYRAKLDGFEFKVHGIDGPDGNLSPTAAIAREMKNSDWGWHDKPQGDGFGHVLHGWAAVGRPLIGHASHYTTCLGNDFFQDGVTCVDLDQRDLEHNATLIREISNDYERHLRMCVAIRDAFDRRVNFDREEQAIRTLLT